MQIYTKTDSWFQKPHGEFGQLQTISGKSKKLKFDGLLLSKKYISSAKSLYLEDLCNITFNCLCENPPNSLRHFETISHFSRHNSSVFLAQTLHIFDKNSPSKYKFSDFPLLALNFTKFLMLFFSQKVSSSSEFRSLFSVIRDNSSVLF